MRGNLSAVILSAGLSSRMPELKPLLRLGEETLLERVAGLYRGSGIDEVVVVVGHRREEVIPAVRRLAARAVVNPRYEEGMFSSVVAGIEALSPASTACFVHPVDIPLVRPETIARLMTSLSENPDRVIYPCFRGKKGHPPLIPSALYADVARFEGSGGLRASLRPHEDRSLRIETDDENILFDVDRPEDYETLLRRLGLGGRGEG